MIISGEQQLKNVAEIVLRYTEPSRIHNRRPDNYHASKEEIASSARQLAEMVLKYLETGIEPVTDELPF